jgi:5-methylcytosine-specific restriction enzyme A
MSTNRRGKWGAKGKAPSGRPYCYCGCGREVPKGCRTTATATCYSNWAAKNDPAYQRQLVKERDKGICAMCGVDTVRRAREATDWEPVIRWLAYRHFSDLFFAGQLEMYPGFTASEKRYQQYRAETDGPDAKLYDCYLWASHHTREEVKRRYGDCRSSSGHTWEADHIVPVIEGGGECDLSNLRTLCLPCHRKVTAELAKRRAAAKRAAKAPVLQL